MHTILDKIWYPTEEQLKVTPLGKATDTFLQTLVYDPKEKGSIPTPVSG